MKFLKEERKYFSEKIVSLLKSTKTLIKKPFKKFLSKSKARQTPALKTPHHDQGNLGNQEFARVALIIMGAGFLDPVFVFFCTYPYRYNPMGQVFERVSRFTEHFD